MIVGQKRMLEFVFLRQSADKPAKKARIKISQVLSATLSIKGSANIPPKDKPVSIIENIQSRILPKRFESGIQSGTDKLDGTM